MTYSALDTDDDNVVEKDVDNESTITEKSTVGTRTSLDGGTLQDINDEIPSDDTDVYLDLNGTFSGNTTVSLDPDPDGDGTGRYIAVDAYGATIDYTGSTTAIEVLRNMGASKKQRVGWLGGLITGPGTANANHGFRVTDHYAYILEPFRVSGFDQNILIRNVDDFSEEGRIRVRDATDGGTNEYVAFEGVTVTGGTGSDSFKGTELWVDGGTEGTAIVNFKDGSNMVSSFIRVDGHLSVDNSVGVRDDADDMGGTVMSINVQDPGGGLTGAAAYDIVSGYVADGDPTDVRMRDPANITPVNDQTGGSARFINRRSTGIFNRDTKIAKWLKDGFRIDNLDIGASSYVGEGDNAGHIAFGGERDTASTSNSAYTQALLEAYVQWDQFAPGNATLVAALGARFDGRNDQIDVRIRNVTDSETVVEKTGITTNSREVITSTYTPTTTSSAIELQYQHRNADNASSVTTEAPTVTIGSQL